MAATCFGSLFSNSSVSVGLALAMLRSSHMPWLASTERVWNPCRIWYASVGSSGCITSAYRSQNALDDSSTKLMWPWIHHMYRMWSVISSSLASSSSSDSPE